MSPRGGARDGSTQYAGGGALRPLTPPGASQVPSNLAFGDKGIKSSPGKPKIPGGATIDMEVAAPHSSQRRVRLVRRKGRDVSS